MEKYINVNWVDGMKINKNHFIQTDKFNTYKLAQLAATFMGPFSYGLDQFEKTQHGEILRIEHSELLVLNCCAITQAGTRINISPEDNLRIELSSLANHDESDCFLLVVITANIEKLSLLGNPDAEELPPRFPFSKTLYEPTLIPSKSGSENYNQGTSFVIGRLVRVNDSWEVDKNFIPAAIKINNETSLRKKFDDLMHRFQELEKNATGVLQKARSKKRHGEINDLADNTFYLIEKLVFYLVGKMPEARNLYGERSPAFFFSFCNGLGRIILQALNCIRSEDKEALLRYYESHLGFKPHQFESEVRMLSELKYLHHDIFSCLTNAENYLETIFSFVAKSTRLEYHSAERVDVIQETTIRKRKLDIF